MVHVLMYIVKRRANKISKECTLVKMFKRSKGNMCMSFGFWFWQFDRSGAADRVMVTNTSVGDISNSYGTRVVCINVIEVGNHVKVGIVRVSEVMS